MLSSILTRRAAALVLALSFSLLVAARPAPGAEPAAARGPIHVTDATGRVVTLAALPRRIVVAGHGPFMTLDVLEMFPEARERVVGLEERGSAGDDFLAMVDSSYARKTVLRTPGPEQIVALHPDLVVTRGSTPDPLGTALGEVNIPIVYLGLETPDQFRTAVANIGALLGDPARAQEVDRWFSARLARVRTSMQVPGIRRPRVLLLEYNEMGGTAAVRVPARPWMQTLEVQTAGGDPVWLDDAAPTSGWTVTNIEQIARWDPDEIVVVVRYSLDAAQVLAKLRADREWGALRAVKKGALHAFPSDVYGWDSPDPRWILGIEWLAKTLHPERFRDLDLTAEIHAYFGTMYRLGNSAIDGKLMPRIRLDVH